jgi:hypothetical protein
MTMTFWVLFWKVCLVAALAVFACTAVLVSIGGAADIGRLIRRLREVEPDEE